MSLLPQEDPGLWEDFSAPCSWLAPPFPRGITGLRPLGARAELWRTGEGLTLATGAGGGC